MNIILRTLCILCASVALAGSKPPSSVSLKMSGSLHSACLGSAQKVKRPSTAGSYVGIGGNLTGIFSGKKDGLGFGAVGAIDLDKVKDSTKRIAEVYVFVNGEAGGTFVGALEGPATTLMQSAIDVIGGAKGPLGWVGRVVELPIGVPLCTGLRLGPSNKVAVTTASMKGLIVGFSFAPDSSEGGRYQRAIVGNKIEKKTVSWRNVVEMAANYTKSFDGKVIGLHIGGVFGSIAPPQMTLANDPNAATYAPVSSFQAGALLDFGVLRFACGYFNWGKSAVRNGMPFTAPRGFDVGLGATLGPVLLSGAYFRAWRDVEGGKAISNMVSLSAEYLMAPGCTVYAEVDFVSAESTKEHTAEAGKRDFDLDKTWDGGGYVRENGGPVDTTAQVFSLGIKLQC